MKKALTLMIIGMFLLLSICLSYAADAGTKFKRS